MQYTPKYRRRVFEMEKVRVVCKRALLENAQARGMDVGAIEFAPDDVHLFLVNCNNYSASNLTAQLKGYSAYMVRNNVGI